MKKFLLIFTLFLSSLGLKAQDLNIFNHLGADLTIGTNGIGIEAVTPITNFVTLRAGAHFMPNFRFHTDVDADYQTNGEYYYESIQVDMGMGRTQGSVIFNVYPIPLSSFFVAVGGYFGGEKIFKVHGHTDNHYLYNGYVNAGGVGIPIDSNGDIDGGFKVKGFRPYVGLGFGRALPKNRLAFNFELGVQFEGKPKAYTNYGELKYGDEYSGDDLDKITKYFNLYPVISFKLAGKIF